MSNCKRWDRVFLGVLMVLLAAAVTVAHDDPNDPHHHHHSVAGDHLHTPVTVPSDMLVPTINITVLEDAMSGWNLHILTTHFRWAPEFASGPVFPGEGHAHLYINGVKIGRLYGPWHHIPHLELGSNEIRVTLNANNHGDWLYNGVPISDTVIVEVE